MLSRRPAGPTTWRSRAKTSDELNNVGDMSVTQLDSKLCLAMPAMLNRAGKKARDVRAKSDRFMLEHARKGRITRGRQIAQLVLDWLKTVDQSAAVCCLGHLGDVNTVNEDPQGFLTRWNIVLDGLPGGRPNDLLLRDSTRDKLLEFVEAVITTKRQRHNMLERDALMAR
jgi:hypothetical protein